MNKELSPPYWHQLLKHFELKGYIQNGLTIPFLIGSLEIINPNRNQWTISELTKSFNDFGCTILKCPNIREFVIGSLDNEILKYKNYYHNPCGKIIVTDASLSKIKSSNDMRSLFEQLYQPRLDNKEFSKNNGIWVYFSQIDLARIKEIL
ncbi:hypothetical protein ASG38_05595 [Flavobacterium sp. Leaf359]|uniref:hypothetical protein n=1 Tax=Flavobacterium sp. Leaf359 TaxID=1736351 RepID=UPI0006FE3A30|nr:hypothetical protein [Flavobacterium sp. Leaf359]KQS48613.1 hypothetical protein ASG38_05595 [Flavobacterium sp. Leaf359]